MGLNKKGVELQFHWIFVMIAGALILTFFVTLAMKQKTLSEVKLQHTLSTNVDAVLIGAIVSKGVAQALPTPPGGLKIECSSGCYCRLRIGNVEQSFENKAIFSPGELKDRTAIAWSRDWELPFRVQNMLFLTNPNIKYYFVYDDADSMSAQLYYQLRSNLPPSVQRQGRIVAEMNVQNISSSVVRSIVAGDETQTKFVFINVIPTLNLDSSFRKHKTSAVAIMQVPIPRVEFYEGDGSTLKQVDVAGIAGLSTLYAAIFSEDANMYKCGLQTGFKRLSFSANIYANRARALESHFQNQGRTCAYLPLISLLERQAQIAKRLGSQKSPDNSAVNQLQGLQGQIDTLNRQLVQQSCSELF